MAKKKSKKKNIWLVPSAIAFGAVAVLIGLMFLYIYLIGGFKARYEQLMSFAFSTNAQEGDNSYIRLGEENATEQYYIFYKADPENDETYTVIPCYSTKIENVEGSEYYLVAGKETMYEGNEALNKAEYPYDSLYYKDVINSLREDFINDGRDFDAELLNNDVLIYRVYTISINPEPFDATELDFDLKIESDSQYNVSAAAFGLHRAKLDENNQVVKDRKDYPVYEQVPYDISNEKQVYANKPIEILLKQNLLDSDDFSDNEYYINAIYKHLQKKVEEALSNGVWNLEVPEGEEIVDETSQKDVFDFTTFEDENLEASLENYEILKSRYKLLSAGQRADYMYLASQEIYVEMLTDAETKYSTHFEVLEENITLVNLNGEFTLSAVTSDSETTLSGAVERQSGEVKSKVDSKTLSAQMVDDLNGKKMYIDTSFNVTLSNFVPLNSNMPYGVTPKIIKYFSSDEKIATVNSSGKVTVLSGGEFTIFAFMASLYEYEKYFEGENIASFGDLLNKFEGKVIFSSKTYETQEVEVDSIRSEGSLTIGINSEKEFTLDVDTDNISLYINPDPQAESLDYSYTGMLQKLKDVTLKAKIEDKITGKITDCEEEYIDISTELVNKGQYYGVKVKVLALNEFEQSNKRLVIECALGEYVAHIIVEIKSEALYDASALNGKTFAITYEPQKDDALWKAYYAGERVSDTGGFLASDLLQEYIDLNELLTNGEEEYIVIHDDSDYKYLKYFVNSSQDVFLTTQIDYTIKGGEYRELAGLNLTRVGVSNSYSISMKEGILYPLKASTEPVTIYPMLVKTEVVNGEEKPVYISLNETRLYYYNGKYYTKYEGWNSTEEDYEYVVDFFAGNVFKNEDGTLFQDDTGEKLIEIDGSFHYVYTGKVYVDENNNPYTSGGKKLYPYELDGVTYLFIEAEAYTTQVSQYTDENSTTHYMVNGKTLYEVKDGVFAYNVGKTDTISEEDLFENYYTYSGEEVKYSWLYEGETNKYYYSMYELVTSSEEESEEESGSEPSPQNDEEYYTLQHDKVFYLEGGKSYYYDANSDTIRDAEGNIKPHEYVVNLSAYSSDYYKILYSSNTVTFENQNLKHTDVVVNTGAGYSKVFALNKDENYKIDELNNIYVTTDTTTLTVEADGNYYYNGSSLVSYEPSSKTAYFVRSIVKGEGTLKFTLIEASNAKKESVYFIENGDRINYSKRTKEVNEKDVEVHFFSEKLDGSIYNDSYFAASVYKEYNGPVYSLQDNNTTYYYDNSGTKVFLNESEGVYYSYSGLYAVIENVAPVTEPESEPEGTPEEEPSTPEGEEGAGEEGGENQDTSIYIKDISNSRNDNITYYVDVNGVKQAARILTKVYKTGYYTVEVVEGDVTQITITYIGKTEPQSEVAPVNEGGTEEETPEGTPEGEPEGEETPAPTEPNYYYLEANTYYAIYIDGTSKIVTKEYYVKSNQYLKNEVGYITKNGALELGIHENKYYIKGAYEGEVYHNTIEVNEVYSKNDQGAYILVEEGVYNYNERQKYHYLVAEPENVTLALNNIYYYKTELDESVEIQVVEPSEEIPFYYGENKELTVTNSENLDSNTTYYINLSQEGEGAQYTKLQVIKAGEKYFSDTYEKYTKTYEKLYMVNASGYYYYDEVNDEPKLYEEATNLSPEELNGLNLIMLEPNKVYKLSSSKITITINSQNIEVFTFIPFENIIEETIYHDNTGSIIKNANDAEENNAKYLYTTESTIGEGIAYSSDIKVYYEKAQENSITYVNSYTPNEKTLVYENGGYKLNGEDYTDPVKTIIVGEFYDLKYGLSKEEFNKKQIYFNAQNGLFYKDAEFTTRHFGDFSMVAIINGTYYNFNDFLALMISKGEEALNNAGGESGEEGEEPVPEPLNEQVYTTQEKLIKGFEVLKEDTHNTIFFYTLSGKNVVYVEDAEVWALSTKNYFVKEILDENFTFSVLDSVDTSKIKRLYTYNKEDYFAFGEGENNINISTSSSLYLKFTDGENDSEFVTQGRSLSSLYNDGLIKFTLKDESNVDVLGAISLSGENFFSVSFASIGKYTLKVLISANLNSAEEFVELLSINLNVTSDALSKINASLNTSEVGIHSAGADNVIYYQKDENGRLLSNDKVSYYYLAEGKYTFNGKKFVADENGNINIETNGYYKLNESNVDNVITYTVEAVSDNLKSVLLQNTIEIDLSKSLPNGYMFSEGVSVSALVYNNENCTGEPIANVIEILDQNNIKATHFGVVDGKVIFKYNLLDVSKTYYVKVIIKVSNIEGEAKFKINEFATQVTKVEGENNVVINNGDIAQTYYILDNKPIDLSLKNTDTHFKYINYEIDSIELFNKYNGTKTGDITNYGEGFKIVGLNEDNNDVTDTNVTNKTVTKYGLKIDTTKAWMDYNEYIIVNLKISTTFGYAHESLIKLQVNNNAEIHFYLENETYYGGAALKSFEYDGTNAPDETIAELFKVNEDGLLAHCEEFEENGTYYYTTSNLDEIKYSAEASNGAGGFIFVKTSGTATIDRLFIKDNAGYFKEYGNPTIEFMNGLGIYVDKRDSGIDIGYGSYTTYDLKAGENHLGYVQGIIEGKESKSGALLGVSGNIITLKDANNNIICQVELKTKTYDAYTFSQKFDEDDKFYSNYNGVVRENIVENTVMELSKYINAVKHENVTGAPTITYTYAFDINGFADGGDNLYSVVTSQNETLMVEQDSGNIEVSVVQKLYYKNNGQNVLIAQIVKSDSDNYYLVAGDLTIEEISSEFLPICIKYTPTVQNYTLSNSSAWYLNMSLVKETSSYLGNHDSDTIA